MTFIQIIMVIALVLSFPIGSAVANGIGKRINRIRKLCRNLERPERGMVAGVY